MHGHRIPPEARTEMHMCLHCIFRLYSICLRISVIQINKSALNRTFSTESYRNWRKSINILKNNGLFLKNKQNFLKKENNGLNFY